MILGAIPKLLEQVCVPTARDPPPCAEEGGEDVLQRFCSRKIPAISLQLYLNRFHDHSDASPSTFILTYIYIERLLQRLPEIVVTPRHLHRLVFTAWMTAVKFHDDTVQYTTSLFGKIAGIRDAKLLCGLEADFLCLLGFDLCVDEATFALALERIGGGLVCNTSAGRLEVMSPGGVDAAAAAMTSGVDRQLRIVCPSPTARRVYSSPSSRFSCEKRFQLSPATPTVSRFRERSDSLAPLRLEKTLSGVSTASDLMPFASPVSIMRIYSGSSLNLDGDEDLEACWYYSSSSSTSQCDRDAATLSTTSSATSSANTPRNADVDSVPE